MEKKRLVKVFGLWPPSNSRGNIRKKNERQFYDFLTFWVVNRRKK